MLKSLHGEAWQEFRRHQAANVEFQSHRAAWPARLTRACLDRTKLPWLLVGYLVIAILVTWGEAWNDVACADGLCPIDMPSALTRTDRAEDILREVAGFMLGVQTGLLGVLSIAVALVTMIGQRDHADADVRVYYHESFAVPLAVSSLGLLSVLCLQLFWPSELLSPVFDANSRNLSAESALTGIHLLWLVANIFVYVQFTLTSLRFGQERHRIRFRALYTIRVSAPQDIYRGILRARYMQVPTRLPHYPASGVSMGPYYLIPPAEGAVVTLPGRARLRDVWLGPLSLAVRLWHRRLGEGHDRRHLAFLINFDGEVQGRVVLCRTHLGGELTNLERFLIRVAFRFGPAS